MTRARVFATGAGGLGGGEANITLATLAPFLTTANVKELTGNIYFSNSRLLANLQTLSIDVFNDVNISSVPPVSGQALIWDAGSSNWKPGNVLANAGILISTTDDLPEGTSNLYYTNARARFAISAANPTIIYDPNTGTISANVSAIANTANTTDSIPEGFTNKYFTNARVLANIQTLTLDAFKDVDYNQGAPANNKVLVYRDDLNVWFAGDYTTNHAFFAELAAEANIVLRLDNLTSDYLPEGNVNLYYSNAKVASYLGAASINIFGDVNTAGNINAGQVLAWTGNIWAPLDVVALASNNFNAGFAERSGSANVANQANIANLALTASYAINANYANFANTSAFAINANIANVSLSTYRAQIADFATIANVANTVATISNFSTTNLKEGANLYFTNTRARAAFSAGNFIQIEANGRISTTFTNIGTVYREELTTANVVEIGPNLYYSNSRVLSAIVPILTTANIVELVNLYFTNARAILAVTDQDLRFNNVTVSGELVVSGNVATFNVSNLTTESRVITVASAATGTAQAEGAGIRINGANALISYTQLDDAIGFNKGLTIHGNILPSLGGQFYIGSPSRPWHSVYIGVNTLYVGNASISVDASGALVFKSRDGAFQDLYTANLRATESVQINRLTSGNRELAYIGGNVLQFVSNTTGNLYFGALKDNDLRNFAGIRVTEARTSPTTVRSDVEIYTDSEGESNSTPRLGVYGDGNIKLQGNVYVNNTTLRSFVLATYSAGAGISISANGTISSTANITVSGVIDVANTVVSLDNHTTTDLKEGSNLYYTNARARAAFTAGSGITIDANGVITSTVTANISAAEVLPLLVGQDLVVDDLTVWGDLTVQGNVVTLNTATLNVEDKNLLLGNGLTSTAAADGAGITISGANASILYYNTGDKIIVNKNLGILGSVTADTIVANTWTGLTTTSVVEGSNLYFTNARVVSALSEGSGIRIESNGRISANLSVADILGPITGSIQTNNVRENPANLYYTNARAIATVTPLLTTANVIETSANLYFTNARAIAAVTSGLTTANISENVSNLYYTNARVLVAVNPRLTTANVTELTNLYFTNARSIATITPLLTTANVTEGTNQYFTNARAVAAMTGSTVSMQELTVAGNVTIGSGASGGNISSIQNITLSGRVNFANATNIVKVYQVYNPVTNSLDTIFT